jgi:hypothetical protein
MVRGALTLHIYEHGDRAEEILTAVAEALGVAELTPNNGPNRIVIRVDDVQGDWEIVEKAIAECDDDAPLIVALSSWRSDE